MKRWRIQTALVLAAVVVLGGVLWWWRGAGSYRIVNAQPTGRTIVALGDSLTQGVGAPQGQAYPDALARRLGRPIINAGVAGNTTAEALGRLEADVLAHDPGIVLVCLGGNDMLRGVTAAEAMANLETIVRRIQQRGALVILLELKLDLRPDYDGQVERLARRLGCPFVPDILGGIREQEDLMTDWVHPNARGYEALADKIEPVVRPFTNVNGERQ